MMSISSSTSSMIVSITLAASALASAPRFLFFVSFTGFDSYSPVFTVLYVRQFSTWLIGSHRFLLFVCFTGFNSCSPVFADLYVRPRISRSRLLGSQKGERGCLWLRFLIIRRGAMNAATWRRLWDEASRRAKADNNKERIYIYIYILYTHLK